MLLSAGLAAAFTGALAILVGTSIGFGHRYGDAKAKLLEKAATELNEVRLAIRDEETIPTLGRLWGYFNQTNQEIKRTGREMDVNSLSVDVERRGRFNDLINDILQSFRNEMVIKKCWDDLLDHYGQAARALYSLAVIAGIGGYSIIILGLTTWLDSLPSETGAMGTVIAVSCSLLAAYSVILRTRIGQKMKVYQDAIKKYLLEVPKLK
jgi:hypothetical protein